MARVLIVDGDEPAVSSLLRMLHETGDAETRVERSAGAALQGAIDFGPDLVLVDIDVPDLSGYQAALLLHQHPQMQKTRLIALTKDRQHTARERARASGFERYLVKPVTRAALREVLAEALQ